MRNLRPKDNPPPEFPRMLGWTENYASTHHFKIPRLLVLRISGSVRVPLMCIIMWTILSQTSRSGARTLVVRNARAVQVSGLDRLVAYKVFATRLWNHTVLLCGSFLQSSLTLNRFYGAALVFVPSPLGSTLSKAMRTSSMKLIIVIWTWPKIASSKVIPKYLWTLPLITFILPDPSLKMILYSCLSHLIILSLTFLLRWINLKLSTW